MEASKHAAISTASENYGMALACPTLGAALRAPGGLRGRRKPAIHSPSRDSHTADAAVTRHTGPVKHPIRRLCRPVFSKNTPSRDRGFSCLQDRQRALLAHSTGSAAQNRTCFLLAYPPPKGCMRRETSRDQDLAFGFGGLLPTREAVIDGANLHLAVA